MTRFVLDASFAVGWVLENERRSSEIAYYEALSRGEAEALVPALWPDEISNVFLTLVRAKKLTSMQATVWLEIFQHLPIQVDAPSVKESLGEVHFLAQAHGLTSYDARYLHLAMREGVPLASRDKQLLSVGAKVGIKLIAG